MNEVRITALVESETHKWTGVPIGVFKDIVVFVLRNGLDDGAAIQSGPTCIDDTHRMRFDSKVETGQIALYRNPIVTESETLRYGCQITERIVVFGCTGRFRGNEMLSLEPMGMIALGRFELCTIAPLVARIKTPPNPIGEASDPYEWGQLQQELACLYGLLVNIEHVNALSRPINHLSCYSPQTRVTS